MIEIKKKIFLLLETGLKSIAKEISSFFIDNSNIDASCLNESKLHLNRKGTSYLANNFNIKGNIYDSVKHEKALECFCISPMFMLALCEK